MGWGEWFMYSAVTKDNKFIGFVKSKNKEGLIKKANKFGVRLHGHTFFNYGRHTD